MESKKNAATAGFQIFTLRDHARVKGMWAGALEKTDIPNLRGVYDRPVVVPDPDEEIPVLSAPPADAKEDYGAVREIKRAHTPAVLKIIDEALVNASDHAIGTRRERRAVDRVTRIALDFDPQTGGVVVENDGPGIPVVEHEKATASAGHPVFVPEVAFSYFLAGSNMEKPPDSVKGGINGIGGKLINVHSTRFTVETVGRDAKGSRRPSSKRSRTGCECARSHRYSAPRRLGAAL